MRLLDKHSRYILVTNLLILMLGGILFFYLFNHILDRSIRQTLLERKEFALRRLAYSDSLYIYQRFSANVFSIQKLSRPPSSGEHTSDTTFFDPIKNQESIFRQLTIEENIRGKPYQITVRRPLVDRSELLEGILFLLLLLTVLLIAALYFANRLVALKLWKPFEATLSQLRSIQIDEPITTEFAETSITEFQELNESLRRLMERIKGDYYALKEYTEYTTHEIQTPLAIIRSKLELLQENNLSLQQLQWVNAANQAVSRLARLKEALLLLVRIKNRQYDHSERLHLAQLLQSRLTYFEELMQMTDLTLSQEMDEAVTVLLHPILAEIMVDNLLSNAIKHNFPGGEIAITLTEHQLIVRNTGEIPSLPTDSLFNRFVKSNPSSKSLGLGLAIVKTICETNRWSVDYQFKEGIHQICVQFKIQEPC